MSLPTRICSAGAGAWRKGQLTPTGPEGPWLGDWLHPVQGLGEPAESGPGLAVQA